MSASAEQYHKSDRPTADFIFPTTTAVVCTLPEPGDVSAHLGWSHLHAAATLGSKARLSITKPSSSNFDMSPGDRGSAGGGSSTSSDGGAVLDDCDWQNWAVDEVRVGGNPAGGSIRCGDSKLASNSPITLMLSWHPLDPLVELFPVSCPAAASAVAARFSSAARSVGGGRAHFALFSPSY